MTIVMKWIIWGFFIIFYGVSITALAIKVINSIIRWNKKKKKNITKLELYNNKHYSKEFTNMAVNRISDSDIRSSVRYHNSKYKTKEEYEEYRADIIKLNLP